MRDEDDTTAATITVEVVYATPEKQRLIALTVPEGTTAYTAVLQSGIIEEFEEIDPETNPMGIFSRVLDGKSRPTPKEYVLQERDRVEIYRPLQIDPKQARLQRAGKARDRRQQGDDK